jgi:hypothetical protein
MKLYKYLPLLVLLGMASATNATSVDPGVILRGDGNSLPVGPAFPGGFQTTTADAFQCTSEGDRTNTNCFQNVSTFTFIALHLTFHNPSLSYGCGDNGPDPFFTNCSASDNEITFSCGEGGCPGIPSGVIDNEVGHFLIGLVNLDGSPDITDTTTYSAVADLPVGSTPEPASVLLFVIAMGAIALFLKRA